VRVWKKKKPRGAGEKRGCAPKKGLGRVQWSEREDAKQRGGVLQWIQKPGGKKRGKKKIVSQLPSIPDWSQFGEKASE